MGYLRNDSTPLPIKAKAIKASDGSAITTGVTAYHITGVTRTAGAGTLTHIANGLWSYTPTQGETNYEEFSIEFYHVDAVGSGPVVQIFTSLRVADEVWDEARSSHITNGTYGKISEWAGGGISTGARRIVVTVQDQASRTLEGALVRMTKAAETYVRQTGSGGTTTFALDDGMWTANVTLSGYLGASTTHIVDSTETPLTVTLQQISFGVSPPGTVTGYATVLNEKGQPEAGVTCGCILLKLPEGTGTVGATTEQEATSDSNGLIQFAGLIPGATYSFRRGGKRRVVEIPSSASGTYELPNFLGNP